MKNIMKTGLQDLTRRVKCFLLFVACAFGLGSCGIEELLEEEEGVEEEYILSECFTWLSGLSIWIDDTDLQDVSVSFPQQAWNKGVSFLFSENEDAEGGINIPVAEGSFSIGGLDHDKIYYYCLRSDSLSVKGMIHTLVTAAYTKGTLVLSDEGDRIRCEIKAISDSEIIEKGFYSEEVEGWKFEVEGDDFSIPIDSTVYSMIGYVIQEGGMSVSDPLEIAPRIGPIVEVRQGNGTILQYELSGCFYGEFRIVYEDGSGYNLSPDDVRQTSDNSCVVSLVAPEYSSTVSIYPKAQGYYGPEFIYKSN